MTAACAGSIWLMKTSTLAFLRKLKNTDGALIFNNGMQAGKPAMLLGYPLEEVVDMPDIAADSLAVAFCNFKRGYVVVDRFGVAV